MPSPTKIQHPLLDHPGMSQRKRGVNMETLRPEFAKLDDRSMVDMLLFIHGYARNVIFHEQKEDAEQQPYAEVSNWVRFFENSLPFQLARFSAIDPDKVESDFEALAAQVDQGKTVHDLLQLFDFMFNELFLPVERIWPLVNTTDFAFLSELDDAIQTRMVPLIERYVTLRNTAAKYLCIEKLPFDYFTKPPWDISVERLLAFDNSLCKNPSNTSECEVEGGKEGAIAWFRDQLTLLATDLFRSLRRLVESAPGYIEASLDALEERNEPHLGLLFAFIRLYTHFQNDLNNLSVQHLNFFYEKVLRIQPRDVEPDKVHLIFEIANHLNDGYFVEQGTVFRDGKDSEDIDVDFTLDQDLVIDKAQVVDVKTLYLNKMHTYVEEKVGSENEDRYRDGHDETESGDDEDQEERGSVQSIIEGIHIAPVANSADGKGEEFTNGQSTNWATLGSRRSKFAPVENIEFQEHPDARIGFALSSSVLFLNEGKREIKVSLKCEIDGFDGSSLGFFDFLKNPFEETFFQLSEASILALKGLIRDEALNVLSELLEINNPYPIGYATELDIFLTKAHFPDCAHDGIEFDENEKSEITTALNCDTLDNCFIAQDELTKLTNLGSLAKLCDAEQDDLSKVAKDRITQLCSVWLKQCPDWEYRMLSANDIIKKIDYELEREVEVDGKKQNIIDNITQSDKTIIRCALVQIVKKRGSVFLAYLSGSDSWIKPEYLLSHVSLISPDSKSVFTKQEMKIEIYIGLSSAQEPVAFFDNDIYEEKLALDPAYPVLRIELNPKIVRRLKRNPIASTSLTNQGDVECCLLNKEIAPEISVSLYHFFRRLFLLDASIDVKVCNLRDLVVQNEENLQDVNDLILPFGVRPLEGAEFYIGNREMLCKQWSQFYLNIEWKDRPENFETHYADYFVETATETDGAESSTDVDEVPEPITNDTFTISSSILENGEWIISSDDKENPRKLFVTENETTSLCINTQNSNKFVNRYAFSREDNFMDLSKDQKDFEPTPLGPVSIQSREGFLRLKLGGSGFLHDSYPFVLARNQIKLAGLITPTDLPKLQDEINKAKDIVSNLIEFTPQSGEEDQGDLSDIQDLLVDDELGDISIQLQDVIVRIESEIRDKIKNLSDPALETILKRLVDGSDLWDLIKDRINQEFPKGILKHAEEAAFGVGSGLTEIGEGRPNDAVSPLASALQSISDIITIIKEDPGGINLLLDDLKKKIDDSEIDLESVFNVINEVNGVLASARSIKDTLSTITGEILGALEDVTERINKAEISLDIIDGFVNLGVLGELGTPNEPYTPLIKNISIDYDASAGIDDITLVHLYPFEQSSKVENATLRPTLFPHHTDEGTLFIGLTDVRPGSNLQLLFQLAEATADSESDKAEVEWAYLTGNDWKPLRTGFEIISDDTNSLTRSGIVKIALPRDISKEGNTIMPPVGEEGSEAHVYWLKVSAPENTAGVAETIDIHTQAATATYQVVEAGDKNRVDPGLPPAQISKPLAPDFSIKKVKQPYASFGGKAPEREALLYKRVSEHLRHKGRSIDAFDVEHLVLEAFPSVFKCRCISHTLGLSANEYYRDLEVAPGFMVVAVIPDLTKLKTGDGLEPKVPVSLLEEIKQYLKKRMSPFARLRLMNPRYEKIKVDTTVRIKEGRDEVFHLEKLKKDLTHFLAPWHLGDSDKLSFGQVVTYSEVIGFIENLDYIDFVSNLELFDAQGSEAKEVIVPATARSILTGGEICVQKNKVECNPSDDDVESDPIDEPVNESETDDDVRNRPVSFRSIRKRN